MKFLKKIVLNKGNLFKEIWGMVLNSKVYCSLHKTFLQINYSIDINNWISFKNWQAASLAE